MNLIRIEDISEFAAFSQNIEDRIFEPSLKIVEQNEVEPFIGAAKDAIKLLNREDAADMQKELYSFWLNYVRPYVVFCVLGELLLSHGRMWTREAIVQAGQTQAISDKARAELIQKNNKLKESYKTKMVKYFNDVNKTLGGITYEDSENMQLSVSSAGISSPVSNRIYGFNSDVRFK